MSIDAASAALMTAYIRCLHFCLCNGKRRPLQLLVHRWSLGYGMYFILLAVDYSFNVNISAYCQDNLHGYI
jgi:hypothetical protein